MNFNLTVLNLSTPLLDNYYLKPNENLIQVRVAMIAAATLAVGLYVAPAAPIAAVAIAGVTAYLLLFTEHLRANQAADQIAYDILSEMTSESNPSNNERLALPVATQRAVNNLALLNKVLQVENIKLNGLLSDQCTLILQASKLDSPAAFHALVDSKKTVLYDDSFHVLLNDQTPKGRQNFEYLITHSTLVASCNSLKEEVYAEAFRKYPEFTAQIVQFANDVPLPRKQIYLRHLALHNTEAFIAFFNTGMVIDSDTFLWLRRFANRDASKASFQHMITNSKLSDKRYQVEPSAQLQALTRCPLDLVEPLIQFGINPNVKAPHPGPNVKQTTPLKSILADLGELQPTDDTIQRINLLIKCGANVTQTMIDHCKDKPHLAKIMAILEAALPKA